MFHHILKKQEFEQKLIDAGDKLVVVDFYDSSCGPCINIDGYREKLSSQYYKEVIFLKVNVDDCDGIAEACNITRTPSFVYMKKDRIKTIAEFRCLDYFGYTIEKYMDPSPDWMHDFLDEMVDEDEVDYFEYL